MPYLPVGVDFEVSFRVAFCLERDPTNNSANAALKQLALNLGEIEIGGRLRLATNKVSIMFSGEADEGTGKV